MRRRAAAAATRANSVVEAVLRAAALVVSNRRWAATASAMALGFGLFVGVAIGPGASGTIAGGAPQIVELPGRGEGGEEVAAGSGATQQAPVGAPQYIEPGAEALPATLAYEEPAELATVPPAGAPPALPAKPAPQASQPQTEGEAEPEGQPLQGTVVHANPAAGSYALAIAGGELVAVHSGKLPSAGTKLSMVGRPLANGTFAEAESPERKGRTGVATFTGTVTYADPDPVAPSYTVSGRGASVLVRVEPTPGAVAQLPQPGAFATVEAGIGKPPVEPDPEPAAVEVSTPPPCVLAEGSELPQAAPQRSALWQRKLKIEDLEPSTYLELSGLLSGVCLDRPAILLSADDAGEGEGDLLLGLAGKVGRGRLREGVSVLATAEIGPDGALTLTGIAGDEQIKGADDSKTAQGDLKR